MLTFSLVYFQRLKNNSARGANSGATSRYSVAGGASSRDLSTKQQLHQQHAPSLQSHAPPLQHQVATQPRGAAQSNVSSSSLSYSSSSSAYAHAASAVDLHATGSSECNVPLRLSLSLNRSKSGVINPAPPLDEETHNNTQGSRAAPGKAAPGEKRPTFKFTFS